MESSFPPFIDRRPERRDSWSWGPSSQEKKKLEIIEAELQKLVKRGLDGVRVFHTIFHHRVAPLKERTRPMWMYNGPTDSDRASPEELLKDEVWSRLHRVLRLRPKESLDGKPGALHASKLSNLVCSPFFILCPFRSCSPVILTSSRPFRRDSNATSLGRIFRRGQRTRLGRWT